MEDGESYYVSILNEYSGEYEQFSVMMSLQEAKEYIEHLRSNNPVESCRILYVVNY